MKNSFIYILSVVTVLSSFLFTSCEDVVEVELNSEDLGLVSVEAYLNTRPNDNIFVKLEKTLPVDNPAINPAISNALVEVSDNQATPNHVTLDEVDNSGIYKLPNNVKYDAIPGRTYELKITTPDGVVIKASEMLQKVEKLDTVKIHLSARGNFEFLAIFIDSKETPGLGNYYKWDIYKNGKHLNDIENQPFANDELVDGNYIYDFEIFTDFQNPHDDEDDGILKMGDVVYVEQLSISKNTYDFLFGMMNQAFAGSPFSVPPANLPSNLSSSDGKKVLGIFSASDISRGNSVVIDSTNYTPLVSSLLDLN